MAKRVGAGDRESMIVVVWVKAAGSSWHGHGTLHGKWVGRGRHRFLRAAMMSDASVAVVTQKVVNVFPLLRP